jgi:hypothetical protein
MQVQIKKQEDALENGNRLLEEAKAKYLAISKQYPNSDKLRVISLQIEKLKAI